MNKRKPNEIGSCSSAAARGSVRNFCDSYKLKYDGGSITGAKAGNDLKLFIEATQTRKKGKSEVVSIPAGTVKEISYGQEAHGRVGAAIGIVPVRLEMEKAFSQ